MFSESSEEEYEYDEGEYGGEVVDYDFESVRASFLLDSIDLK